jgi:hypothetical protein
MATIDELKSRIDLHELASWLGLKRAPSGNYFAWTRQEQKASVSIFEKDGRRGWKDHTSGEGGSCVDLVMSVEGVDVGEAVRRLHELAGIQLDRPQQQEQREKTRAEFIAEKCLANAEMAREYLRGRGIGDEVISRAIKSRALGFNTWTSDRIPAGEPMHGGPAVAFIVRTLNPGHVQAVDLRYLDPALNGGLKTQCQGDKAGHGFTADVRWLARAKTVVLVESSINALSVDTAGLPHMASFAVLGAGNIASQDWRWLRGKRVLICLDHRDKVIDDPKSPMFGYRPGLKAAWDIHEALTRLDISAMLVDQSEWGEGQDVNDVLQAGGAEELKRALRRPEEWLVQGMPGRVEDGFSGKSRVFLPSQDFAVYWRYRVKEDFTSYIQKLEKNEETGVETPTFGELAGFRVAAISKVKIQGAVATTTGEEDTQPTVAFAVAVQTPRHGAELLRKVIDDDRLHNIDTWKRFGPVFDQARFLRMVNILERGAHLGERVASNFVGLCYREGRLTVSEGADTYFMDPKQQCPYYNLTFPSGSRSDAKKVLLAYQETFKANAALIPLVWALGAQLKVFLGFWPHMEMQADKGHGKSTLAARLERTLAMKVFSKETIKTAFRLITTTAHTSHPVGWEEISANRQEVIDAAVSLLQEAYNFKPSPRGAGMLEFLTCTPVLLIGEDVPVRSLIGKLVRTNLTGKKGPLLPDDLPRFPVRQWLEFLARQDRGSVQKAYADLRDFCQRHSRASGSDDGAQRMAGNYAAVLTAWRFLAEFAGLDTQQGDFPKDVLAEMNAHIGETSSDREPWVWIVETLLSEIASNQFQFPHKWDAIDQEPCLLVRTSHVMDHIKTTNRLRETWNGLPVKSDRVFKKQLQHAGVILSDAVEKTIGERRVSHMAALSLDRLRAFGLHATPTTRID